jgi:hypothetical protein
VRFFSFLDHFSIVFCEISYLRQGIYISLLLTDTKNMFGMHTTRVFIYIQRQFTADFDRSIYNNKTPQSETESCSNFKVFLMS